MAVLDFSELKVGYFDGYSLAGIPPEIAGRARVPEEWQHQGGSCPGPNGL